MSFSVVDRSGKLTADLRHLLDRRLRFALSRFEPRISGLTAVLEDVNGPRGGVDKLCRIIVRLQRGQEVVIRQEDDDLPRCITRAAERAGRAVARSLERLNDVARRSP